MSSLETERCDAFKTIAENYIFASTMLIQTEFVVSLMILQCRRATSSGKKPAAAKRLAAGTHERLVSRACRGLVPVRQYYRHARFCPHILYGFSLTENDSRVRAWFTQDFRQRLRRFRVV
jgi:hypothetical protein